MDEGTRSAAVLLREGPTSCNPGGEATACYVLEAPYGPRVDGQLVDPGFLTVTEY